MLPFCSCKTRITVFPYLTGKAFSWVFSYWVRSIFWDSSTKSMRRETKALAPRGNRQGRGRAAPALGIRHLYRAESRLRDHQPTGGACLSRAHGQARPWQSWRHPTASLGQEDGPKLS